MLSLLLAALMLTQAKDALPELNFNDTDVTVCYPNEKYYEQWDIVGTDNSGDAIPDEVWNRNLAVEERLGIKFNLVPTQGHDLATLQAEMKNLAFTGSADYDNCHRHRQYHCHPVPVFVYV